MYKKFSESKADHFMVIKKFDHPIDRALYFNNKKIYPVNSKNLSLEHKNSKIIFMTQVKFIFLRNIR